MIFKFSVRYIKSRVLTSVSFNPRWEDPLGNTHFVTYVADEDGYRVTDSDVVPATVAGVRADGSQVSISINSQELRFIYLFN